MINLFHLWFNLYQLRIHRLVSFNVHQVLQLMVLGFLRHVENVIQCVKHVKTIFKLVMLVNVWLVIEAVLSFTNLLRNVGKNVNLVLTNVIDMNVAIVNCLVKLVEIPIFVILAIRIQIWICCHLINVWENVGKGM